MIYHRPQDYAERYYIPFSDVEGNEWKVSIQQPEYEGTAIALQGAEIPVEWMGRGDEDQEEVVLGSTGTIRIICREQDVQSSLLEQGNLLPKYINDRRVQVLRYSSGYWDVAWQGFIVPQTLSQDWDAAPFEIELPIASVVACMEYFPMPMTNENCYGAFAEVTNIADMLRRIFCWSGCDVRRIDSNRDIYEDFNGQTQEENGQTVHWTQGVITSQWFYTIESGIMKPKTFKDVLETIAYPFGKIQEYSKDVYFVMRWKHDAGEVGQQTAPRMFVLQIWNDYENSVLSTDTRFDGDSYGIPRIALSDIHTEGEDNKVDMVMAPSSVSFSSEAENNATIFEMSEKSIKSSLPISHSTNLLETYIFSGGGKARCLYAIDKQHVDLSFAEDWVFWYNEENPSTQYIRSKNFCRVVDTTGDNDTQTFSMARSVPFGLCFNFNPGDTRNTASTRFTVPSGIRTVPGATNVKLSITPYLIDEWEPTAGDSNWGTYTGFAVVVHDLTSNKYMTFDGTWHWQSTRAYIPVQNLTKDGNDYILWFNEERDSGDNGLHKISIEIAAHTDDSRFVSNYGRMFCSVKLEYDKNKFLDGSGTAVPFSEPAVLAEIADGITNRANVKCDGSGEALSISFKTRAGNNNAKFQNIVPYNGFCDYPNYIDKQNREKIEISEATFEQVIDQWSGARFYIVAQYCVIVDGSKVYVPVAVGMNPRMNTIKLILVTTNVTT